MCKYNTSIFYSLRFVHRTPWWSFPLFWKIWSQVYPLISDMFQGVEYFSISQARPGKRFIRPSWEVNDGLACEETFQKWSNQAKQSGFSITLWSLYMSPLHHFSTERAIWLVNHQNLQIYCTTEWVSATANNLKHETMMFADHPTVTLILVNGVWVQYIENIEIVVFVLPVGVVTISIQWLFLLHWYHHLLIENDSWCEVHDGVFPLF